MLTWEAAKPVILAEMKRQNIRIVDIARRDPLLKTRTLYHLLGDSPRVVTPLFDNVSSICEALGKNLSWLEKSIKVKAAG